MSDSIKEEIRKLINILSSEGIIEETGQTYRRATIHTIFDNDRKELYNILENIKNLLDE